MRLSDQIADYVHATRFDDFAPEVIERTKDLILSSVGSTVLGAAMELPRNMADYARAIGGAGCANVVGFAFRTSAEQAAMLNAISSHCTELEDVAWPEAQYTCCLLPAVLTLGDALGASGRQVLKAAIVGFEVAARPGMTCSDGGAAARGFLSCANVGTIGMAAAAAKLMGLTREQIRDAVTLSVSVGGGMVRQTGSAAHVVEAGFAARDGIMAASLAARGLGGNPAILEGKAGYFDALAGQPEIAFDLGTGGDLRVMAVGQKKYPCCYMLQRVIDSLKGTMAEHGFTGDDVVGVEVEVNRAFPTIMKYPDPKDVEEARFSLPHVVAATIAGEPMDPRTFSAAKLHAPEILRHRGKANMIVHDEWGYDQLGKADIVTVRLSDGRAFRAEAVQAKGDAALPLSREETLAKYRACTDGMIDAGLQAWSADLLANLEKADSVTPLMSRLSGTDAHIAGRA
ncbi:MmgE/PrpD family protein [Sphingomonas profundi]|uniref:MmgE/PrpD family protein n=1 Tax=Alterirhizorhabdus profundi TaxID=2681549 RepID=UPI0012E93074|nr:MmgE/PrpD family protein [Sphingomonas profundi]